MFTPEPRSGPVPRFCRRSHRQRAYEARRLATLTDPNPNPNPVPVPVAVGSGDTLAELVAVHARYLEVLARAESEGIDPATLATAIGIPPDRTAPRAAPRAAPLAAPPRGENPAPVGFPKLRRGSDPRTAAPVYTWDHAFSGVVLEIRQLDIGGRRRWVARNIGAPVPDRASRFDVTDDPYQRLGDLRADLDRLAAVLDR